MGEVKISIALAAYNGCAHLSEQLDSFVAQMRHPDELVVVDDGSHDGTPDIVRAFAVRAPFPVSLVVNTDNLGYAQNFGKALSLCSGDLVFLSDQDDVWFDTKIATMASVAGSDTSAMCFMNDALLTNGVLVPSEMTKLGQILAAGLPETAFVMGCCVAVKRDLLDIVMPIPEDATAHDNWLVGLSDELGLMLRVPDVLQYYRRHGANVSGFFVNRIEKPGWWKILAERIEQLIRRFGSGDSLDREYQFYEMLATRIGEKRDACIRLVGAEKIDMIENTMAVRLESLTTRRTIRSMGFAKRPRIIAELWYRGGYCKSGGMLGAMKDLVIDLF